MIVGGSRKACEVKAKVDAMDKGKDILKRLNDDPIIVCRSFPPSRYERDFKYLRRIIVKKNKF